jgi:hypothetical protein
VFNRKCTILSTLREGLPRRPPKQQPVYYITSNSVEWCIEETARRYGGGLAWGALLGRDYIPQNAVLWQDIKEKVKLSDFPGFLKAYNFSAVVNRIQQWRTEKMCGNANRALDTVIHLMKVLRAKAP